MDLTTVAFYSNNAVTVAARYESVVSSLSDHFAMAFHYVTGSHGRLLNGADLDYRTADCREHPQSAAVARFDEVLAT